MGVAAAQLEVADVAVEAAVMVATIVVTTVVAGGDAVRMQEQALLSLDGGYVPVAKSRWTLVAAGTVVLRRCQMTERSFHRTEETYVTVLVDLTVGWI